MNLTEVALRRTVEAARGGDPDAWEALYRRAYPRLYAYARRRLATDDQAEDAVSEAMTRAPAPDLDLRLDRRPARGWLFGIARNVVLETYRGGSRTTATDPPGAGDARRVGGTRRRLRPGRAGEWPTRSDGSCGGPSTGLTEQDRELLELRVVVGLGSEAVGVITGRRPGAVRMAQSRALERLRGEYEGLAR